MSVRINRDNLHKVASITGELWADIPNFIGIYQISSFGRVKSLLREVRNGVGLRVVRERIRTSHYSDKLGYWVITLKNQASKYHCRVFIHRLVAQAFIPNPKNLPEVNHKDGNKLNANVSNLEWVTGSENLIHAHATGLKKPFWSNKIMHNSKKVISIQDTSIIEFPSMSHCAKHFNVCLNTIRSKTDSVRLVKNHLIVSI